MRIRKTFSKLILFLMVLLLICPCSSVFAEEQADLWLEMNEDGAEYTVSVQISGSTTIEMLQFCLRYDEELLELKSVITGNVFLGIAAPTVSNNESGKVYLVWDALSPLPQGTLLILKFVAKKDANGIATFRFDRDYETIAADNSFNEIWLNTQTLDIQIGIPEEVSPDSSELPPTTVEPVPGQTAELDSESNMGLVPGQTEQSNSTATTPKENNNNINGSEKTNGFNHPVLMFLIGIALALALTVLIIMIIKWNRKRSGK